LHIPDGFLTPEVAAATGVVSFAALAVSLGRARGGEHRAELVGGTAAFVFAAQMLNFPVAGGTSGHLLGAALAATLLGPWLGCVTVALVLAAQALLFADGGITALGANVLNMAVVGAAVTGLLLAGRRRSDGPGRPVPLAVVAGAAWLSVMAGAAATAVELALSGTAPLGTALPAMLEVHALIGVGEAAITVAAVAAAGAAATAGRPVVPPAVVVSLCLAFAVAPHASPHPDGLERVAADHGFAGAGRVDAFQQAAPLPDYAFPGVGDAGLATGVAGIVGTLAVLALGTGAGAALRRRSGGALPAAARGA
jgi:cobalt/nickel transport system permease protein